MSKKATLLTRERKTVEAMIHIYCHGQHDPSSALCDECQALLDYAFQRIEKCPFQIQKPTCAKCTVHCYKPDMRERIRKVMRYAGPRMLYKHPILTFHHLFH